MSNNKSRSNKPYDPSNSFVKKVASRVSGLIPRSTSWLSTSLSGWFSAATPSEESSSIRGEPNKIEEEHFEDALEKPPPSKRFKLTSSNPFSETYTGCQDVEPGEGSSKLVPNNFIDTSAIPGPSGIGSRSSGFVASTPAVTSVEHLEPKTNGDDCSESGESTSGCSSLEPQITRAAPFMQNQSRQNDSLSPRKRLVDDKLNFTYLQNSRSLYLDRSSNSRSNQTVGRRNNPSFCVNTFGAPLFGERGSINDIILNSPFYTGRTTYGGASSASYRRSLGSVSLSSSPANSEKRHTIKVKPGKSQPSEDNSMSQTAKRILATLEQFSTPILDAKRMPMAHEPVLANAGSRKRNRVDETFNQLSVLEQPHVPKRTSTKPLHWAKGAPNTSPLTIPVAPDTLVFKKRDILPSTAPSDTSTANSTSDSYKLRVEAETSTSTRNTLKMRRTDEDPKQPEAIPEVNLPAVPLPISSLPTFDISVPPRKADSDKSQTSSFSTQPRNLGQSGSNSSSKQLSASITSASVSSSPSVPSVKPRPEMTSADGSFVFSSPIRVSSASKDQPVTSENNFTFSKPLPASMNFSEPSASSVKPRPKVNVASPKSNDGFVSGLKTASELKTGSVMDILGGSNSDASKNIPTSANGSLSLMEKFKPAAGTWECDKCLIRNKSDVSKCVACSNLRDASSKPSVSSAATESPSGISAASQKNDAGSAALLEVTPVTWECPSCSKKNEEADSKCVSCATAKPSADVSKPAAEPAKSFSGWGNMFKPPANTWECSVCMVRNGSELSACQSCTTKKPGSSDTASPVKNSWGDMFKKPEGSWTCSECMITNKATDVKCVACTHPKPGSGGGKSSLEQAPKFSFGIPPVTGKDSETPTFSFGIPKDSKEATVPDKSNVSSSTGFKLGATKLDTSVTTFSFGVPPSTTPAVSATPITTASTGSSLPNAEKFTTGLSPSNKSVAEPKPAVATSVQSSSSSAPSESSKQLFSFGVPSSDSKTDAKAPAMFSFSKPSATPVTPQPVSSSGSLGGRQNPGEDVASSSAAFTKLGGGVDNNITPQAKLVGTSATSVSSTSGPTFSFYPTSNSTSNSGSSLFSTVVTSTASGLSSTETAKPSPSNSIFSSPAPAASSSVPSAAKPALTFSLGSSANKDESVTSTWKPPAMSSSSISSESAKTSENNAVSASKSSFVFPSNVSSSGMAFGSASSATATFGASTDKTAIATFGASTEKTAIASFGASSEKSAVAIKSPSASFGSSSTPSLFGLASSNLPVPSFGSPTGSGFGALTSTANTSQTFASNNAVTPGFSSPASSAFTGFGVSAEEKKPAFSFGAASEPKKAAFGFSAPEEKKQFAFGSSASSQETKAFTFTAQVTTAAQNSFQSGAPVFTFGASSSASTTNGPSKAPFSFGSSAAPSFPGFNSQPPSSSTGFSFGAPSAAPSFGAPSSAAPPNPSPFDGASNSSVFTPPTTFGFGAANTQPSSGFNFSAPASSGFGAQNQSTSGSPFQFSETSKPSFNFTSGAPVTFAATAQDASASSGPSVPPGRQVRKAIRRRPLNR